MLFTPLIDDARSCSCHFVLVMFISLEPTAQNVPSFVDIRCQAGLTAEGQHHAVAVGDYDNDGRRRHLRRLQICAQCPLPERRQHDLREVGVPAGVADEGFTNAVPFGLTSTTMADLDLATGNGFG